MMDVETVPGYDIDMSRSIEVNAPRVILDESLTAPMIVLKPKHVTEGINGICVAGRTYKYRAGSSPTIKSVVAILNPHYSA
jgi:hypothetical protein